VAGGSLSLRRERERDLTRRLDAHRHANATAPSLLREAIRRLFAKKLC
jgi:hypothetical protein